MCARGFEPVCVIPDERPRTLNRATSTPLARCGTGVPPVCRIGQDSRATNMSLPSLRPGQAYPRIAVI